MTKKPAARPARKKLPAPKERRHLSLALQGGGTHGAFTWGVMHRLIEDKRIYINGISGASAGAMNAVAFADGFLKGGRKGAAEALENFWHELSRHSVFAACGPGALSCPVNIDDIPSYMWFDMVSRMFSPYQFNPTDYNPLKEILDRSIDFEAIRTHPALRLFVAATNVRSSEARIFRSHELTTDTLLASSCLPMINQAVEINGEAYWDGGYLGNPAIYPLVRECETSDVLLVMINPLYRPDVPDTSREIMNRLNEISFNATLISEMRGFAVISRLLEDGAITSSHFRKLHFHMIELPKEMESYNASSKLNSDWSFLTHLHELGWNSADAWLKKNFDLIGHTSSIDLSERFLSYA